MFTRNAHQKHEQIIKETIVMILYNENISFQLIVMKACQKQPDVVIVVRYCQIDQRQLPIVVSSITGKSN